MTNFVDQSELITEAEPPQPRVPDTLERRVFRATAVVILTVGAAYVLWMLVNLLLLLFACTLVSLILLTVTHALRSRTRLPFGLALSLTVLFFVAVVGGAFVFFGATIQAEFGELAERLPAAWGNLQARIQTSPVGAAILERAESLAPSGQVVVEAATSALAALGGAFSFLLIVLVGGVYLAAQPTLYATGMLRLIPTSARAQSAETLDAIAVSLKNWLKGQAIGMLFVGIATGIGLWAIGVPAAWAIALVAGLAEFVPYLGVLVAGVPAVVLGFGQGTGTGLWTLAVLFFVQQVQGSLVMPLVQNKMVDLPPAITIFGIIAAGILFGIAGVLLATPLTIVALVAVRRLYLHEDKEEVLESGDAPAVTEPI